MTSDSEQPPGETPALSMPNGTRLSDTYEIEAHIALGGMAEVYRAHNVHTGEPVAIKLVLPEFARDETILALFKKEATVLSRLRHDAIVHYHLFTIEKEMNRPYLVMDYVDGLALSDKLRQGPIAPQAVREMLLRVAAGLELAHGFGVVHRDLSPDNIILPNGEMRQARIIDFGIAKAAAIGDGTLLGGKFAGKYNFVSPEQLGLFGGEVTEQSDIYSLGLVGAAALRGAALDMSGSHAEVLDKRRRVPDLGDIDPSLREVLEAMLEPDPAERLATMGEVIARLQRPPPSSAKTVIRPQGAGDMWTGGARGTRNEPARSPTTTAPVRTVPPQAEAARPIFDPLAPGSGVGESPFGAYVASDDAAGTARTRPPPPNPNPRRSTTGPLLVTVAVLAAGGAALGWGYTQGWLDQLLGRTPPIAEPVPTPEPQPTPEPEPDAVPTPEPAPEPEPGPAPSAPGPTDEPTQDPLALNTLRMAWVSNYPMAACQYVSMVSPAEDTVSVEGYATTVGAFEPLDAEFAAINGKAPDIVLRPITEEQCAVADFLRAVDPLTVPGPELALSSRTARDGVPLAIDITGTSGWDTRLFLIDDEGAIYDISRMLPEGSDGAFDLELNLSGTTEAVPGVLMTVATEPGRELPAIGDDDALTFLPRLALEMAKMPEQVAVNAQYLQLSP